MKKILIILLTLIVISSCKNKEQNNPETTISNKNYDKIEQLKWLVGNWENVSQDQQSYESWNQKNDSTLQAFSHTMILNDTVFQESMEIQQIRNGVILVVSVPNQNKEQPVVFEMLPVENNAFTFSNEFHDFPNKITYSNPVKDSIHAWIEGKIEGADKKMDFYFKRNN